MLERLRWAVASVRFQQATDDIDTNDVKECDVLVMPYDCALNKGAPLALFSRKTDKLLWNG
jgi:hypothetical protein